MEQRCLCGDSKHEGWQRFSTHAGVHACASAVMSVQWLEVCFISQCQRKSVVCPRTFRLALWKCRLAAMTQRFGREERETQKKNENSRERERDLG